jgi:hypothetical protein
MEGGGGAGGDKKLAFCACACCSLRLGRFRVLLWSVVLDGPLFGAGLFGRWAGRVSGWAREIFARCRVTQLAELD